MKTLRDTNNNNSNTTQPHFSSNISSTTTRHNSITSNGPLHHNSTATSYPSLLTQNRLQQQTIWRTNNDQSSTNSNTQQVTSSSKLTTQNNSNINPNPLASMFNGDTNQLSSIIQGYLTKFGGNQMVQSDTINPLLYLQLMNANTMFMQQLSSIQNNNISTHHDPIKHLQNSTTIHNPPISNHDLSKEIINSGRDSQILQADSNIFVPKTRPMTQDEIAEHARLVYQKALQRNQLQQHNDLMKHFYETLNIKQHDSSNTINNTIKSIHNNEVPSVPNVSNIASLGTFDVLDTMITSPSSCLSIKEPSINAAMSSLSLLSADDTKIFSNTSSILDPSAPIFIPRQSQSKFDDDNETSSSSSDSDFNDFHYLDQFLDEFYHSDNEHDNHLIIQKSLASNIGDESSNNNNKYPLNHNILGQGDASEQLTCEPIDEIIEQPLSIITEKQECQYSIYELLNRYRNPRCHLVLPEWSRLSLILPNVCSMRSHTYKMKRYFAYRRRLNEDQNVNHSLSTNIPIQG